MCFRSMTSCALLAAALALASPATAGDLVDHAGRAEAALAAGRATEAVAALEAALDAVWKAAPLTFRKVVFVTAPPTGFGAFTPRRDAVFAPGEPLLVYAEPIGFAWKPDGDAYGCDLVIDVALRDAGGRVIYEKREMGRMALTSHARNHEFMLKLDLKLRGLPAGDFTLLATVHDRVSQKQGTFTLPFTVKG